MKLLWMTGVSSNLIAIFLNAYFINVKISFFFFFANLQLNKKYIRYNIMSYYDDQISKLYIVCHFNIIVSIRGGFKGRGRS